MNLAGKIVVGLVLAVVHLHAAVPIPGEMVLIPGGMVKSALVSNSTPTAPFLLDRMPVTNAEFLEFVRANPAWQRSKVRTLYADSSYLKHWGGDLDLGQDADRKQCAPVTHISWFAARAYATWCGKRLPTIAEWELAAAASDTVPNASNDPVFLAQILAWYSRPTQIIPPCVDTAWVNYYGVRGMHGLVWEWVEDFTSELMGMDSRGSDTSGNNPFFCGGGGGVSGDRTDYAEFMRRALRGSLQGNFCLANLGFRCAKDIAEDNQ